jgi:hypothetical protein
MSMLYKYPHAAFPYEDLVKTNAARSRQEMEYELLDTGVFEGGYHDVVVEYAKASPDDILIRVSVTNRGREAATLHVLPHLWFRNTWWMAPEEPRPSLRAARGGSGIVASHPDLGDYALAGEGTPTLLFTENETNEQRLFGRPNPTPFVKDAIDAYVVHGRQDAVNPARTGTKAAAHYTVTVAPGTTQVLRLRLTALAQGATGEAFGPAFDQTLARRRQEADEFYAGLAPAGTSEDEARVMRQGFAGMLWGKQTYIYDVDRWLEQRGADPLRT